MFASTLSNNEAEVTFQIFIDCFEIFIGEKTKVWRTHRLRVSEWEPEPKHQIFSPTWCSYRVMKSTVVAIHHSGLEGLCSKAEKFVLQIEGIPP